MFSTLGVLKSIAGDVLYAARRLRRRPSVAVVAVLSIALGVGAVTSIFGFVDATVLRPLPVSQPDRVVNLYGWYNDHPGYSDLSYADYLALRDSAAAFSAVGLWYNGMPVALSHHGATERVEITFTSNDYFSVLGIRPSILQIPRTSFICRGSSATRRSSISPAWRSSSIR